LGALGLGAVLVYAFSGPAGRGASELAALFGAEPLADAGVEGAGDAGLGRDAGSGAGGDETLEASSDADPAEEAGADALDPDAGVDGDAVDAGQTPVPLTAHEREEAAKDALSRARRAIAEARWEAAEAALADARRFDPGNPDIDREAEELAARRQGAGAGGSGTPAP
ncbi:MAG TPA: hypothetical protein RMF84_03955, partial [Polyangiaceae bacterium LLY-WYZ-14_1]|nr:hypothetical protein [Polyangiaceae bacterium LLY-WYZ-14_1]